MNPFFIHLAVNLGATLVVGFLVSYFFLPLNDFESSLAAAKKKRDDYFASIERRAKQEEKEREKKKHYYLKAVLGKRQDNGRPLAIDLTIDPHGFWGGKTNSGKTTGFHNLLTSLMQNNRNVSFVLFSMKRAEWHPYKQVTSHDVKILTSLEGLKKELETLYNEMEERNKTFDEAEEVNENIMPTIESYNENLPFSFSLMPYRVVIIDETDEVFLDKEIKGLLNKMFSKSRSVGIIFVLSSTKLHRLELGSTISKNIGFRMASKTTDEESSLKILGSKRREAAYLNPQKGEALYLDSDEGLVKFRTKKLERKDIINIIEKLNHKHDKG